MSEDDNRIIQLIAYDKFCKKLGVVERTHIHEPSQLPSGDKYEVQIEYGTHGYCIIIVDHCEYLAQSRSMKIDQLVDGNQDDKPVCGGQSGGEILENFSF